MYCMEIQNLFQNQSFHTHKETSGVIVLAMGRSGTSMLTGLLSYAGLNLGGPLLKPNSGNAKGFFERIDVMLFNDRLLQDQLMKWSGAVHQYNVPKSISFVSKMHDVGRVDLNFQTAINFMNGPENTPWIVKDPRLCITLPTWLPYLSKPPAVVFTYRHPFDVALSLHTRDNFSFGRALALWYYYNYLAIKSSSNLCRVITSDKKIIDTTFYEVQGILDGLRQCGVPIRPITDVDVFREKVSSFYDKSLRHSSTDHSDPTCQRSSNSSQSRLVLEDLNSISEIWAHLNRTSSFLRISDIKNNYYNSNYEEKALNIYKEALKTYCAIEDRSIFLPNYVWSGETNPSIFQRYLRL